MKKAYKTTIKYLVDNEDNLGLIVDGDPEDIMVGIAEIIEAFALQNTTDMDQAEVLASVIVYNLPSMINAMLEDDCTEEEEV